MRIKILSLSVAVFLFSLFLLFRFYTNAREDDYNEKISIAQSLIKSGKENMAVYDSLYSELKRRGNQSYKRINYSFDVNGETFTDDKQIVEVPKESVFKIIYLPSNPEIHSEDPKGDLEYYKKLNSDKDSGVLAWSLFIGSVLVFYLTRRSYLNELRQESLFD
jgi:hypothetical protein